MVDQDISRKLAVIVHADVAGSTALVQRDEMLAHKRIAEAFQRFSSIIQDYGGTVHEIRGDALVAEFGRASDAICAALNFQHSHTEFLLTLNDEIKPTVRIGVSLGEVVFDVDTVTGAGVVLAQRVEQLTEPGSLCITAAIHEALPKRMPFDQEDLGEQEFKGFEERVRVHRVGLKSGESIPPPEQSRKASPSLRDWRVVATLAIALVISGSVLFWFKPWKVREEPASVEHMVFPLPDKPSIAVLPFTNMSGDPEQEYFVDGMTEDLITDLSKLSGLFVIARNSAFVYKDKPVNVRQVAEDLGVRYVMEGSVRRSGNEVRINAQLIDATTGEHLWAERYDGQLDDVFKLQDEVTSKIQAALDVELTRVERDAKARRYTKQLDAYDSLLKGLAIGGHRSKEANLEARTYFQGAIALDPTFARAYATLANTYRIEYRNGWSATPGQSMAKAYELANKAVELDDTLPQVHFVMALIHREAQQHVKAVASAQRAIELDSNYADARVALASILCYGGRADEGLELMYRAIRLNPHHPSNYPFHLGQCHFALARYEEAIDAFKRGVEMAPDVQRLHVWLAASYVRTGRSEDAEWETDNVLILNPDFSVEGLERAVPFKDPKVLESFLAALRTAGLPE